MSRQEPPRNIPQKLTQMTSMNNELERLSDVQKLSAHVTRVLGQNPGIMTLQGTNSYLLQPPSNAHAPVILIDSSSPHTAQQYVDCLFTHLFHLALESGVRETHFESHYARNTLIYVPEDKQDGVKAAIVGLHTDDPRADELGLVEYGPHATWAEATGQAGKERRLPPIEHIILTHRHLDHVGAIPLLLETLKKHGCPPPKIWKFPSPDEADLVASDRDRPTADASLVQALPTGTFQAFSPFQPLHPIMPGLMISIIDPAYRHLLKHDKDGKPRWNEVPEMARVSVRCLRTPGHTADSVSLVMCEGEKGVFTGDTVLGQGTTVFTDLASYMTSLKTLLALKPAVLYPAHGPHIPTAEASAAHINEYIAHRQTREDEIVALLRSFKADPTLLGRSVRVLLDELAAQRLAQEKYNNEYLSGAPFEVPAKEAARREAEAADKRATQGPIEAMFKDATCVTVPLICRLVYRTSKEGVIAAAGRSVRAHLDKLRKEGKVTLVSVRMPKLLAGEIELDVEQDGWEWVPEEPELEDEVAQEGEVGQEDQVVASVEDKDKVQINGDEKSHSTEAEANANGKIKMD